VVEAISVSGSQVTGSGTSTITVNPADDLAYSTEYYVLIDATAFDDASSNSYAGISDTTALSFTTATVPGAPTALAGSLPGAAGEIALTWTAPNSNGGVAISDYIVEYSTDGTTWTTFSDGGSSTASATVTGLANATAYTFRISAVNVAGTGIASATTSATTATVPGAPTGLTVEFLPDKTAFTWTPPDDGGSVITSSVLEYSSDAGATWTTVPYNMPSPMIELYGVHELVNGTAYLVRVVAVNAVGTGNYSDNLSFTGEGIL
jgi:hypothetical protein